MKIAIVGGGPAGLRAAEVAAEAGADVTLFDAKPSVGRKFLVAGKGGLNLTNDAPQRATRARITTAPVSRKDFWQKLACAIRRRGGARMGGGPRGGNFCCVYRPRLSARLESRAAPAALGAAAAIARSAFCDASPLGRAVSRRAADVGISSPDAGELRTFAADAAVLALGGGSWPETGSDGAWTGFSTRLGVAVAPLRAGELRVGIRLAG